MINSTRPPSQDVTQTLAFVTKEKGARWAHTWMWWLFRAAVSVEAAAGFTQAVLAGGFLAGHYDLLALHQVNATVTGVTAVVMTLAGVLLWRPGGGSWWPAVLGAALFAAEAGQIVLGYSRVLILHIPLGVGIIAALLALLVWAWRPVRLRNRPHTGSAGPSPQTHQSAVAGP